MYLNILILLIIDLVTVESQIWTGTFNVTAGCDTTACCCPTNQAMVIQSAADTLTFNTSITGVCFYRDSVSASVAYPNGYSFQIEYLIITLTITLSSDSNSLTITNSMGESCGSQATRTVPITTTIATVSTPTLPGGIGNVPIENTTIIISNSTTSVGSTGNLDNIFYMLMNIVTILNFISYL